MGVSLQLLLCSYSCAHIIGYVWTFGAVKMLPIAFNSAIHRWGYELASYHPPLKGKSVHVRFSVQSAKQGLYHIPWVRETWNDILIRHFTGISLHLKELTWNLLVKWFCFCLFIACNLSCLEQVRVFIFLNNSHWANVQRLLKWKRLHVQKDTPYTKSTYSPKLVLNLTPFRIVFSVQ